MFRQILALAAVLVVLAAIVAPAAAGVPVPQLISPPAYGAMLDNGRTDRLDDIVWDFDWSDVPGASHYHLYVIHSGSWIPVIDRPDLTQSSFHDVSPGAYIIDANRFAWTWKVRAKVDGVWGDWSPVRTFDVEPVNTDPPSLGEVALIVDPALLPGIRAGLDQFEADLRSDGYTVVERVAAFATPGDLRSYLVSTKVARPGLVGAILIGDMPHAYQWVVPASAFNPVTPGAPDEVISFQYYCDLDGVFSASPGYMSPGGHAFSFDQHTGNTDWEIWVGVLPMYKGDYGLTTAALNRYFVKNHSYRAGGCQLPRAFLEIYEHYSPTTLKQHYQILASLRTGVHAWTPYSSAPNAHFYFDSAPMGLSIAQGYQALSAGLADFTVGGAHGTWAGHGGMTISWVEHNPFSTIFFWSGACSVGNLDYSDNFLTSVLYSPTSAVLVARGTTSDSTGLGTNADGSFGHNIATALAGGACFGAAILRHVNVPLVYPWSLEPELHYAPSVVLGDPTLTVRPVPAEPATVIIGGPPRHSSTPSASFLFSGSDDQTPVLGLSYAWRLDGGSWSPWSANTTVLLPSLAQGVHTFYVKARDGAGQEDLTPASRRFVVDTSAPQTSILSGPAGTIVATTAAFTYTGTDNYTGTAQLLYSWRLDGGSWSLWSSSTTAHLTGLGHGAHVFYVKVKDEAGNEDPTPARRLFTVSVP
jgi:hypothetical protein